MSARIVSAEEARARFLAAESDVRGVIDYYVSVRDALATVPDDIRERLTVALAELVVGAAQAERDAALARVARLEQVLAVERGDEEAAGGGWTKGRTGRWSRDGLSVYRGPATGRYLFHLKGDMPDPRRFDFALEAMEAADAAGEPR